MASIDNITKDHIKNWIMLDVEIEKRQRELEELRNKRDASELQIINYMNKNGLSKTVLTADKYKLSLAYENVYTHLSYTFIEKTLSTIFNNPQQAKLLCNKIKTSREKTINTYIKRHLLKNITNSN